jgi:hypothetical protein
MARAATLAGTHGSVASPLPAETPSDEPHCLFCPVFSTISACRAADSALALLGPVQPELPGTATLHDPEPTSPPASLPSQPLLARDAARFLAPAVSAAKDSLGVHPCLRCKAALSSFESPGPDTNADNVSELLAALPPAPVDLSTLDFAGPAPPKSAGKGLTQSKGATTKTAPVVPSPAIVHGADGADGAAGTDVPPVDPVEARLIAESRVAARQVVLAVSRANDLIIPTAASLFASLAELGTHSMMDCISAASGRLATQAAAAERARGAAASSISPLLQQADPVAQARLLLIAERESARNAAYISALADVATGAVPAELERRLECAATVFQACLASLLDVYCLRTPPAADAAPISAFPAAITHALTTTAASFKLPLPAFAVSGAAPHTEVEKPPVGGNPTGTAAADKSAPAASKPTPKRGPALPKDAKPKPTLTKEPVASSDAIDTHPMAVAAAEALRSVLHSTQTATAALHAQLRLATDAEVHWSSIEWRQHLDCVQRA